MGIFGNEDVKRVDKIISESQKRGDSAEWRFGQKLKQDLRKSKETVIKPEELYCKCAVSIFDNPMIEMDRCVDILEYGQRVYKEIFVYGDKTPDFETLVYIFTDMFHEYGAITNICFSLNIFNLFTNRMNYLKWMKGVNSDARYRNVAQFCSKYGIEARSYFPNEESFTANFIYVCNKIMESSNPEAVYNVEVRNVEHMAGIYEVDEAMLMEAEQQLASAKDVIDRSRDVLNLLENRIQTIGQLSNQAVERVKQVSSSEVDLAQARIDDIDTKLQAAYDKFLDTQRERVLFEKKQLVDDVVAEAEGKLAEFKQNVRSIINMAKLEISKINQESGAVMSRIDNYMKDDAKIKELLKSGAQQEKLMNKLERLVLLNDNNIDLLAEQLENARRNADNGSSAENMLSELGNNGKQVSTKNRNEADKKNQQGVNGKNNSAPQVVIRSVQGAGNTASDSAVVINPEDIEPDTIPSVNPLLDENIEFQERFKVVMGAKKKLEERGEHFHKMFDDVLIAVMENVNPYLIGPSGCGKTYMVGQIAKLLNSSFIDIGYINEEYDILGFQTANGGYSRPNFYRCYKYGKIAFCDELDNGNSKATVKLNSFLSNTKDAGYSFPNGEHVKRHGNFRIIAAGNTSGNGADSIYNTREKIEESVQQRFTPIYVGYDNEVERVILGQYKDWFEFVVMFRNATEAWSKKSHSSAAGIITTRDTARIKKYLDNGSFGMEKIIDYEFIQTKDESYLAFLASYIEENLPPDSNAFTIAKCFINKVDAIRNGEVER